MRFILFIFLFIFMFSCSRKHKADFIIINAIIYAVDSNFSIQESFAVKNGKFIAVGKQQEILNQFEAKEIYDAKGKYIYPGFIDGHCHFLGYAKTLSQANLIGTTSFNEIINILKIHQKQFPSEWIIGRGWDQNDWELKDFPSKELLDEIFPEIPVYIKRVDGHAALVNSKVLELANISKGTKINGGLIEINSRGELTGILLDNAMDLVEQIVPPIKQEEIIPLILQAQYNCLSVGLTTLDDAGLDLEDMLMIDSLQKTNDLKLKFYVMMNPTENNFKYFQKNGIYKTEKLHVRSFKIYADGALGSRGACLLHPYNDLKNHHGFLLNDVAYYRETANKIHSMGFQMNTHCIGDSANRFMLHVYGNILKQKNNNRWRIEHAQVLQENDFSLFGQFNIIPSVQPTHATSDMYWAKDRVGEDRIMNAYAYKKLYKENKMIVSGSDFPVENINPLYGFYAAVSRKDHFNFPENGFMSEQSLSREEALKAMTIWAAYANFEENEKGSIEVGKAADFVILAQDIMRIEEKDIILTNVLENYISGENIFTSSLFIHK